MATAKEDDGEYNHSILRATVFGPALPALSYTTRSVSTSTEPTTDGSGGLTLVSSASDTSCLSRMNKSVGCYGSSVVRKTHLLLTAGGSGHNQNLGIRLPQLLANKKNL